MLLHTSAHFWTSLTNRSCDDKKLQQIIRNNPNSLLVLPVVFPEKRLRRSTALVPAIMREASPQRKWTSKEGMMEAEGQIRNSVVVLEAGWGSDVTRLPPTVGRVLVQSHHRELDCQGWLWTSQKHPESCDREISIAVDGKVALSRLIFLGFLDFLVLWFALMTMPVIIKVPSQLHCYYACRNSYQGYCDKFALEQ